MDQKIGPVVLVVDGEPLTLINMAETLKAAGYEVWQAHHAEEALRTIAVRRTPISALVTDVEMPGEMDGCELAWRVAATSSRIALIVVSGKGAVRCGDYPPNTLFLTKPVDGKCLINEVRRRISRR
jgi:FixJ family two-component response regulator